MKLCHCCVAEPSWSSEQNLCGKWLSGLSGAYRRSLHHFSLESSLCLRVWKPISLQVNFLRHIYEVENYCVCKQLACFMFPE